MAGQAASRNSAIEDSMRNAVDQAMATIVQIVLLVKKKSIVTENILSQTSGYLQKC